MTLCLCCFLKFKVGGGGGGALQDQTIPTLGKGLCEQMNGCYSKIKFLLYFSGSGLIL